jgi:SAM-dependent methyltransferase
MPLPEERNLSHHKEASLEVASQKIRKQIIERGDLPQVTTKRQLALLDQIAACEIGKFLIERGGLNGYWTHYIVTYPNLSVKPKMNEVEDFLLNRAPTCLATQQRFQIFKQELQKRLFEGANLASIPSGLMTELIELDFSQIENFTLTGIDLDGETIAQGKKLAKEYGLMSHCQFFQKDAWNLEFEDHFDLITSNGLSIYEPDDEKVTALYKEFFKALKPGGSLITSFLTPPPIPGRVTEWNLAKVKPEDALLQKIILSDILGCKWQAFRSSQTVKIQLERAGFEAIELIHDEASIFPTVVARKPLSLTDS